MTKPTTTTPDASAASATVDPSPTPAGYAAALGELESILATLERSDVPVDTLATHVSRATQLIAYCRTCIGEARLAIDGALGNLESGGDTPA